MPGQYTTPPKASSLNANDTLDNLRVNLDITSDLQKFDLDLEGVLAFQRAANYLSAAQIFLQSNALLVKDLKQDDVKPRLLGHWGTCAGLNLIYAHASALITRHAKQNDDVQMLYVTGPGHGAPAILAALYIEVRTSIHSPTSNSLILVTVYRERSLDSIHNIHLIVPD